MHSRGTGPGTGKGSACQPGRDAIQAASGPFGDLFHGDDLGLTIRGNSHGARSFSQAGHVLRELP